MRGMIVSELIEILLDVPAGYEVKIGEEGLTKDDIKVVQGGECLCYIKPPEKDGVDNCVHMSECCFYETRK